MMIGRTGRQVPEKIFVYGKGTNAANITEKEEDAMYNKYTTSHSSKCLGYVPAGETYVADYKGRFGKGKMLFEKYNHKYCWVTYLIEK